MAEITGIDFTARKVSLVQGSGRVPIYVDYDHLVIAVGQRGNLDMLPGFTDHSITVKNLSDAHRLRNHVIQCLEHADITEDTALKTRLLTFVVAGGGFSGIETVGELAEMIRRTLRHYPNVTQDQVRLVVIQRDQRILPELPEKLAAYAHRKLEMRGVEVIIGAGLNSATSTSVTLDTGVSIDTQTLVATIGNGPTELVQNLPFELSRGKILTAQTLQVPGVPGVWALGDCAAIPLDGNGDNYAPPTAQFATAEAQQLADNIARAENDQDAQPFHFKPRGSLASIGHYSAVAQLFGLTFSGLIAWFMWRGFYILRLPGFSTKVRVTLNWMFDYLLPRNIVQIRGEQPAASRYATYKKGDVLFKQGQIPDGLYTVASGALESRVGVPGSEEEHVRVLHPGEHWGERSLNEDWHTKGTLTAIEDSRVLIFQRADLRHIRAALPVVDTYFKSLPEDHYAPALRTPAAPDAPETN